MTDDQAITTLLDAAIAWAEWRFFACGLEVHPEERALFYLATRAQVERERTGAVGMTEGRAAALRDAAIAWAEWRHAHGPWEVHRTEDALWRAAEMTGWSAYETGDGR